MIEIRELHRKQAGDLAWLFTQQAPDYLRWFQPFEFDVETLDRVLDAARTDVFLGLYVLRELVGLVMLRGFDEGYPVPALGIMVDFSYTGTGLSDAGVEAAKAVARLRNCERIMLKVHPENAPAQKLFRRHGFIPTGEMAGLTVMHCELSWPTLADVGSQIETVRSAIQDRFGFEPPAPYCRAFVDFVGELTSVTRE